MTALRLFLLLGLLAPACATAPQGSASALDYGILAQGDRGGPERAGQRALRTAEGWRAFWAAHGDSGTSAPHVDFARDMVVVIGPGERPGAGHGVEVVRVVDEGGFLRVSARATAPSGASAGVMTRPFVALRLPRRAGPVAVRFD